MWKKGLLMVGLLLLLMLGGSATAQEEAVVHAVLFYSPTCPHCHDVIDESLPPIQEQFGDQLRVLLVDVSKAAGAAIFRSACVPYNIPAERCGSVPTMLLADEVMVGSVDIPMRLPGLTQAGIAAGGVEMPDLPGLAIYAAERGFGTAAKATTPSLTDDPIGSGAAFLVLAALLFSLALLLKHGWAYVNSSRKIDHSLDWLRQEHGWQYTFVVALGGLVLAASLVLESDGFSLPNLLALLITLSLTVVVGVLWAAHKNPAHKDISLPAWVFPLVVVVGLSVAGYLAYVEVSESEAVCGAVGNCNLVQQSDYASLFGVLPIGVLGVAGYVFILGLWFLRPYISQERGDALMLLVLLFGVVFSVYLTLVELFIIGAVCAWCLTSAMLMLLLLWLQAPQGWQALHVLRRS